MTISYAHYYFHQDRVLLTHAYATSTTATTVGDGGNPCSSTELDDKSGHNCCINDAEFWIFANLVLGLDASYALLLLGSDALTPSIIQRVWGANDTIRKTLGGPHGDLALIRQCLMSISREIRPC